MCSEQLGSKSVIFQIVKQLFHYCLFFEQLISYQLYLLCVVGSSWALFSIKLYFRVPGLLG